jgi:outer membrane protein TolC
MTRLPAILMLVWPAIALGQALPDTVGLAELHARARAADPRDVQRAIVAAQARIRLAGIAAERRPQLALETQAQYQSDVPRIPVAPPGSALPPHDTYDARVMATQKLYDPTAGTRRALEQAQLGQTTARVEAVLHVVRQQVNDLFFTALRAQSQADEITASIAELEAQRGVAEARVREGAALPSEAMSMTAEILRRRQLLLESETARRAALQVLGDVIGASLDSAAVLRLPPLLLEREVADVRHALDAVRARPEFEHFARSREVLALQERLRSAQDAPRVAAFGRAGYGRPGLNPLNTTFDSYWLAGVQLQWTPAPFNWGASVRDREVLALQRRIIESDERAFANQLRRAVAHDLATIDRLAASLATDDEIIALREKIAAETRARFAEGAVTSAEYVDRQTDVLSARLSRAIHRTELAQARARVLTTLGIEVR